MSVVSSIFEMSSPGRKGFTLPGCDVPETDIGIALGAKNIREDLPLPEVSEVDVIRHFTRLSSLNYGIDTGFYPLGSCTMKYNPKINEQIAEHRGLSQLHPLQDESLCQGMLQILYEMQRFLAQLAGMDAVTLQPAAGAHGELTAMMVFKRHFDRVGEAQRHIVIVPDSSHGTNPATAARCGYVIQKVPSGCDGLVDTKALSGMLNEKIAALMLTNPNTLGLFEKHAAEISELVHDCGALLYCDGANMNAILGIHRPGDAGFDAMHFNLHKTFGAPHGGGGPGSGPVAVKEFLAPYLPYPTVGYSDSRYYLDNDHPYSIGKVHSFYGNIGVAVKAYAYILSQGNSGLRSVSEHAVLNANYLLERIKLAYDIPYGERCMHEFVASAQRQKTHGVRALDIAKRLMDYGYHPPTIYFPLIVPEALMIEPTETESMETIDAFADSMLVIAKEAEIDPEKVHKAPIKTPLSRLDEAAAARKLELTWSETGD